jgi:hypothetical protein
LAGFQTIILGRFCVIPEEPCVIRVRARFTAELLSRRRDVVELGKLQQPVSVCTFNGGALVLPMPLSVILKRRARSEALRRRRSSAAVLARTLAAPMGCPVTGDDAMMTCAMKVLAGVRRISRDVRIGRLLERSQL